MLSVCAVCVFAQWRKRKTVCIRFSPTRRSLTFHLSPTPHAPARQGSTPHGEQFDDQIRAVTSQSLHTHNAQGCAALVSVGVAGPVARVLRRGGRASLAVQCVTVAGQPAPAFLHSSPRTALGMRVLQHGGASALVSVGVAGPVARVLRRGGRASLAVQCVTVAGQPALARGKH